LIRDALLAASLVGLCSADLTFDPHVAVFFWSDHTREEVPAINRSLCECARERLAPPRPGLYRVESYCDHPDAFPPGWDRIKGRR